MRVTLQYFTAVMLLMANVPQRANQEATSFAIIQADAPGALQVSLDQGGYGELPTGLSLELDRHSPLYLISSVTQSVTIAYGTEGVRVRDSRSGATDANGNLLTQNGVAAVASYVAFAPNGGPTGAQTLLLGIEATTRRVRIARVFFHSAAGDNIEIRRYTGNPVTGGVAVTKMDSTSASQSAALSYWQIAGFVVGDVFLREPIWETYASQAGRLYDFRNDGVQMPTANPGEKIGVFSTGPGVNVQQNVEVTFLED